MLCYQHCEKGEICTNRCPKRPECTIKKIPFLVEALDILVSDLEAGEANGMFYTSFKSYCIAPEAYINDLVFAMMELTHPTITSVTCAYCDKSFILTTTQKHELLTDNYTKYNKTTYLYCSKECQENHLQKLSTAKSIASRSLKNHDWAIVTHGADVTKRPKEQVIHLITGNVTKQRAGCVREKLLSMSPRKIATGKKVKCLYPEEIQSYISKELHDDIKVPEDRIQVTASELITILPKMYPYEISVEKINRKTRVLIYIN